MKTKLLAGAAVLFFVPAAGGPIAPWTADFSRYSLTVGGEAHGTIFAPDLPQAAGFDQHWASGLADLTLRLERDYDTGMSVALDTSVEIARDKLSYDNYGGDLVQKVYGVVRTGLGRLEIGMTDGAAYALSVTGPVVDDATSLDNANAGFFLDPSTRRDFTGIFALNSAVEPSLNYAKISYYTPLLFGVQVGFSFTPSEGKEVIPFLNNGPDVANRQKSIWEGAVRYGDTIGRTTYRFYLGGAVGRGDRKTAGHAGLSEWGMGGEVGYELNDDMKLAFGGAWRRANTYGFDLNDARTQGITESVHFSGTFTWDSWILGGEIGSGTADGGALSPVLGVRGYEGSLGYVINANWQATLGWQELIYRRDLGTFYDGSKRLRMDALFFHLKLHI